MLVGHLRHDGSKLYVSADGDVLVDIWPDGRLKDMEVKGHHTVSLVDANLTIDGELVEFRPTALTLVPTSVHLFVQGPGMGLCGAPDGSFTRSLTGVTCPACLGCMEERQESPGLKWVEPVGVFALAFLAGFCAGQSSWVLFGLTLGMIAGWYRGRRG